MSDTFHSANVVAGSPAHSILPQKKTPASSRGHAVVPSGATTAVAAAAVVTNGTASKPGGNKKGTSRAVNGKVATTVSKPIERESDAENVPDPNEPVVAQPTALPQSTALDSVPVDTEGVPVAASTAVQTMADIEDEEMKTPLDALFETHEKTHRTASAANQEFKENHINESMSITTAAAAAAASPLFRDPVPGSVRGPVVSQTPSQLHIALCAIAVQLIHQTHHWIAPFFDAHVQTNQLASVLHKERSRLFQTFHAAQPASMFASTHHHPRQQQQHGLYSAADLLESDMLQAFMTRSTRTMEILERTKQQRPEPTSKPQSLSDEMSFLDASSSDESQPDLRSVLGTLMTIWERSAFAHGKRTDPHMYLEDSALHAYFSGVFNLFWN